MPEAAFFAWVTRLVRSHRLPLIHLARREGLLAEDAFDAVQEAFHSFLLLPPARALVEMLEGREGKSVSAKVAAQRLRAI
jgi:RNA polymerase sigma-70 factor (ECF subfamily)